MIQMHRSARLTILAYALVFTATISLLGFTTGLTGPGMALGVILGGWYGYLRARKVIGLGPVWLLFVMAAGGLLGPAIDADRPIGAIILGICYGWIGFLSDRVTKYLFVAIAGFAIGGILAEAAGCIVGAIIAIFLFHGLNSSRSQAAESPVKHESEQRVADEAHDRMLLK